MQRCERQAGAFSPSVLVLILTTIPKQLHALRTPLGGGSIGRGGGGIEELIYISKTRFRPIEIRDPIE